MYKAHYCHLLLVILISASILSGCLKTTSDPSPDQQLLSSAEDKPYPQMDTFFFESVPFEFALKLSYRPYDSKDIPKLIEIDKTIAKNRVPPDTGAHSKIQTILKSFQDGTISEISVIGNQNESFSLKGKLEHSKELTEGKSVTFQMELNSDFEMVSFKKEIRLTEKYLQKNSFTVEKFVAALSRTYGRPHHTFAKSNSAGVHKDLWWGADGSHLITSRGYDFANGSHWKGFRGKTFYVSIHDYSRGDILITQTMKDNFKAFRNGLLEQ